MFPESWLYILGILFILTVLFFEKGFWGLIEMLENKIKVVASNKSVSKINS
jgi:urea transport system permease protein